MRASIYTLGCKVNQNESGALAALFEENGYTLVGPNEDADVVVVNSCTVTNFGDQKSRAHLRRAKRRNPGAVCVLTGCYPQAFPEEAAQVAEADVITGTTDRRGLLGAIERVLHGGEERVVDIRAHERGEGFEEIPLDRFAWHTRAFIKAEDGCDRQCAYCVIPRARGPVRSRTRESLVAEMEALAAKGYREVVLTGISLPSYGRDTGDTLTGLLEAAEGVQGISRVRLGSLDPDLIRPEDIRRFAGFGKLCPQFHLSLQAGCTATLRRMRRPYTAEQYAEVAAALREVYGEGKMSLTTDVIVGFPGETEEDYQESCRFVEAQRFLKVHVFPFSRRTGTPAAGFPNQIPEKEKLRRSQELTALCEAMRAREAAAFAGKEAEILLETPLSATLFTGYTREYLPVAVTAPGCRSGDLVTAVLGAWDGERSRAVLR